VWPHASSAIPSVDQNHNEFREEENMKQVVLLGIYQFLLSGEIDKIYTIIKYTPIMV
jgi:hypothetical protein